MAYLETSLTKLNLLHKANGVTYKINKLNKKEKLKMRFVYIFNFLWFNTDVVGAMWWFIDGILTGKTFIELTFVAPCVTFSILANAKILYLIYYEDVVSNLIDDLKNLDDKVDEDGEKIKIKTNEIKFLHRILKTCNILNFLLFINFALSPTIIVVLNYIKSNEVKLVLPFLIKYMFDPYDIKYWPFAYIHQIWSNALVILHIAASDFLLYICCIYLRIQFRLLQYDIENIIEKDYILDKDDLVLFHKKFAKLVIWHQEIIRLSNLLEKIFAKSILINFMSSSILICLTGFNVIALEDIAFAVAFLVFLSASLVQIFLLCYFGDLLMESSMGVSSAMYNSKWYHLDAKSAKSVLIVLTRTEKPCKLTAFGFSDVNFRAFMSILSSAWSYFALLKTLYSPAQNEN